MKNKKFALAIILISLFFLQACSHGHNNKSGIISIQNRNLTVEVDASLRTKIISKKQLSPLNNDFNYSEYLVTRHHSLKDYNRQSDTSYVFNDSIGKGKTYVFTGLYHKGSIQVEKHLRITVYDSFPNMAVFNTYFVNKGEGLYLTKWVSNNYNILFSPKDTLVWSFQGGSSDARSDWIRPVSKGFYRKNYLGMTSTDYGGGIPVTDVWRRDVGVAIGHLNMFPLRVSLPVESDDEGRGVDISIQKNYKNSSFVLSNGDTLKLPQTFTTVHTGDFFSSLREFSKIMQKKGITFSKSPEAAYEPIWCAWGYERNVTPAVIIGTLPEVKKLGFKWVVIDDGYQRAIGDWRLNKTMYPGGNKQMEALVDKIHSYGLKAKIWYAPMIISAYTKLMEHNPELAPYAKVPKNYQDVLLLNKDGSPRYITWWGSFYMGPTYSKTIALTKKALHRFFDVWGFDGVKLDGQFQNAVPPDYNPAHHLKYPAQASQELPGFYKMIDKTIHKYKPNAVIEICPGGTVFSFYNMPYLNQAVASDPTSSWQIRTKGAVYKALLGNIAYFGDHVELSDGGDDFASTVGIGGVPGSKFTWPENNPTVTDGDFLLTPEKAIIWKKWISIYKQKMLSKANYLGTLYDIGWDKPETYVLQKADTMFYSFYAKKWSGKIQLRGLKKEKDYVVYDYVNRKKLGSINGKSPFLEASFQKHLLIEVYPNRK